MKQKKKEEKMSKKKETIKYGTFELTTNVIVTYQDKEQDFYDSVMHIDVNCSEYGLEKALVTNIARNVMYPNELVKLSLCVYGENNSKEVRSNKAVTNVLNKENGKYYFQPDQRSELIEQICKEYPYIAKDTPSYKDSLISQGIDPIQHQFNCNLISCFNHKRINEFKKKYHPLIEKTFGDVLIKSAEVVERKSVN